MNLSDVLNESANEYICIDNYIGYGRKIRTGAEWLKYFGDDVDMWDVVDVDETGADDYDVWIAIR